LITTSFFGSTAGKKNSSTLSGTIHIILGDSMTGRSFVEYQLYTDFGEYVQIYPSAPVPMSYSGKEVTVTGTIVQLEGRTTLNATSITLIDAPSASYSPVVSGTRKIAMLLLRYSDSAAYTPNDAAYYQNLMNPLTNSVNAFYREESYGLLGVQADVYGWYTLPNPRSYYVYGSLTTCGVYFDRLKTAGVNVANAYVNFPQYDDVSFVMNDYLDCCAWGGSDTITADGQTKSYGTTYEPPWGQTVGTYAHEIGHSLGCPHTGWVYGTYDSIWDVESGGTGFNGVLRSNYYSVARGQTVNLYSYNPCHHIAYHKIKLGWLDTWYSEVSSGTQTLTVNALAGTRINLMAVKIRIPGQDPTKKYFTVESRTKINYDQWLPAEGVIIHFVDEDRVCTSVSGTSESVPAYPIDSTPGTNSLNDAQWGVLTTYNNATYGLSISILSKTGNSYQVTITYAGGGFDFSLSNSGGISVTPGGSGSNTITVTLTSGTTQTVTLSASGPPSGASASFNPTSGNPTFTSTCTISTLSSTPAGSYTVTVTGTGGGKTHTTTFTLTVNPSDFARVSSMTFQSGENELYSAVIDPSGQYAYFGTWTAPGRVVKIRLSDMTRIGAISLLSGENNLSWGVIDPGGQYAYFGTYTSPGRVVKIGLSSFTRVGAVMLNTGENELNSGVIDRNGQFAYFCTNTIPGIVVKIRLFDMTRIGAILLQSGEDKPMSAVIDPSGQYAYFGTTASPGKVVKIGLSTFTRAGAIAFQSGENNPYSALMDPNGQFAYFGTTTSPGRVVKIGLSSFTRVGAVMLNTGENELTSAVIDPSGQYAYFGTWTAPGRVVKIRLSDMTRIGAISLLSGENALTSAVIDPNGQYAYFGTDTSPGKVVKISLPLLGFYFSLSNSGGISVTPGGSGSNTITVTLMSGSTQTVALSISGLPSGATASFNPASGNPTYSSTCTITTTSSTPTGSYTVTVTGTGGGITRTTMFTLSSPVGQAVTTLFTNTSYTLGFMVTGNIYDDSGTGYMCAHRSPPKILFPKTDTGKVLSTGQLTWSGYTHLVTVGGRGANPTTAYYEDNGLAPLWYFGTSTNAVIMRGSEIKLNVPISSLGPTNDYFVIQIVADGSHKVVILYGITQYGTYASGVYFDFVFPSLSTLSQGWYIIRWQDLNGNGIPDYPTEFTIHASGN
jgi:M6 family metalloprotease-like protein